MSNKEEYFCVTSVHRDDVEYMLPGNLKPLASKITDVWMQKIADGIGDGCTGHGVFWDTIEVLMVDAVQEHICDECGEYPCDCEAES